MDRLTTLELFVRIVDRGSFSAAAADAGVSRSVATAAVKALEQRLGARLLQRTARHVQPTMEGEAYYRRCLAILAALEEADRAASGQVDGVVRMDAPGNLARTLLLPALPMLLVQHPDLTVHIGEGERFVDLIREGVDCVLRAGESAASEMRARRLGILEEITVASPDYLARHGVPETPDDLAGHQMIGFVSSRTGKPLPLEFTIGPKVTEVTLPARLLVSGADTGAEAARRGFGLVQAPRYRFAPDVETGSLVEVLANFPPPPTPLSVLYPSNRLLRHVSGWSLTGSSRQWGRVSGATAAGVLANRGQHDPVSCAVCTDRNQPDRPRRGQGGTRRAAGEGRLRYQRFASAPMISIHQSMKAREADETWRLLA